MVDSNDVAVGDFLEASVDAPVTAGVYRVVGTPADALVLLRVTDEGGSRASTGEVVRVDASDATALDVASEPRGGLLGFFKNLLQGPYWMVRSLLPF